MEVKTNLYNALYYHNASVFFSKKDTTIGMI